MQYRTLGKTGWNVSTVSLGCWGIGGQWGPVEEKQALDTINAALDAGVNLFDTADGYGCGQSEIYTGKALKSKRSEVYIATKVGNRIIHLLEEAGFAVQSRRAKASPRSPA